MQRWILEHEPQLRFAAFLLIFLGMALWELAAERKQRTQAKGPRWTANLVLLVLDSILVRLLFPAAAMGFAVLAAERGWGLFHLGALQGAPPWLVLAASLLLLDLAIYCQHRLFHTVPLFWRFHAVHHSDQDLDFTSGLRFHPGEIVLSMAVKFSAISLIGAPAVAVLIFEVVLNATSIFNHGNVRMPLAVDRWLRTVLVTPDMHRVHHSVIRHETNSNYGFNLPWWDRLFGTYQAQPEAGHDAMQLGIEEHLQPEPRAVANLLALPLYASATAEPPAAGTEEPGATKDGSAASERATPPAPEHTRDDIAPSKTENRE